MGFKKVYLALVAMTSVVAAEDAPPVRPSKPSAEAWIPFANHGGISDWQVVDESSLLIRDIHGQWYLVRVMGPAFVLPFSDRLAFATTPSGTLEKSSAVVVRGKRYPVLSLTRSEAPGKR